MNQVPFLRASYFVWAIVPPAIFAIAELQGLPHVIWSYDWRVLGPDSHADFAQRFYTRCTYVGWRGAITEFPESGKCGWVRFARSAEDQP